MGAVILAYHRPKVTPVEDPAPRLYEPRGHLLAIFKQSAKLCVDGLQTFILVQERVQHA